MENSHHNSGTSMESTRKSVHTSLGPDVIHSPVTKQTDHDHYLDLSVRQNDQSGSDSGLGYTYSISSENSVAVSTVGEGQASKNVNTSLDSDANRLDERRESEISRSPSIIHDDACDNKLAVDLTNGHVSSSKRSVDQIKNDGNLPQFTDDIATSKSISSSPTPINHANNTQRQPASPDAPPKLSSDEKLGPSHKHETRSSLVVPSPKSSDQSSTKHNSDAAQPKKTETGVASPKLDLLNPGAGEQNISKQPDTECLPPALKHNGLVIRSALKKYDSRSINVSSRSQRKDRSVSFNQTVIVFCEEIESSPSDQFEPSAGYQDGTNSLLEYDTNGSENASDHVRQESKSLAAKNIHDDLNILSKIVGKDGINLTRDQLFGLLENGSILEDVDFNHDTFSDEDECTIDQINQSYVCQDAISDSDSESSMVVDDLKKRNESISANKRLLNCRQTTRQTQADSSKKSYPEYLDTILSLSEKQSIPRDWKEPQQHENTNVHKAPTQLKSLPARMKVSTVDSQFKRQQLAQVATNDQRTTQVSDESRIYATIPNIVKQDVINKSEQRDMHNSHNSMTDRQHYVQSDVAPKITPGNDPTKSRLQNMPKSLLNQNHKPSTSISVVQNTCTASRSMDRVPVPGDFCKDPRPLITTSPQHKSQQLGHRVVPRPQQSQDTKPISQDSTCHVCRAIELSHISSAAPNSNIVQPTRSSMINSNSFTGDGYQRIVHLTDHNQGVSSIDRARVLRPVSTNQSCLSCIEGSNDVRRAYNAQSGQANVQGVYGQQQAKPIACQLVYIVDQNGNRVRALQVLDAATSSSDPSRILVSPNENRMIAPNTTQPQNSLRTTLNDNQTLGATAARVQAIIDPGVPQTLDTIGDVYMTTNGTLASSQRVPVQISVAPKNHTVYYVRQPLVAQDMRLPYNLTASVSPRSFPDAHEVRRLDGIRAPATNLHANNQNHKLINFSKSSLPVPGGTVICGKNLVSDKDDCEDPSFGFSRRPAVKVVSTVNNQSSRN